MLGTAVVIPHITLFMAG